jgi:hypothetical protein
VAAVSLQYCSDLLCLPHSPALPAVPAGLTFLDLSRNAGVSDVALPIVGQQLCLLKQLHLAHTGITDLGAQWLRRLHLDTLGLCGCKVQQQQFVGWKVQVATMVCSWCRCSKNKR